MIPGREIQYRPKTTGITDAGPVGMAVVERPAEFGMIVKIKIGMTKREQPIHLQFGAARRNMFAMVGIGQIRRGRGQESDFGHMRAVVAAAPRWPYEKSQIILTRGRGVTFAGADMQGIWAA